MDDLVGGYYRLCVWVTRFAYVNVLWILFTFLGLVFLGAMPSTVAMFAVIRKWVTGDKEVPIFKTFLESYRTEFVKANIDRKSTRLNSSHISISYAVFCLKKKN